ncbi:SDR family oxidoreductase [Geobacter pelophilus]|uniref:SDR family oxidoreductase n=1 Tax=Geoanaerobacter pelophilus TaxID=60036 RepID=A0AAW4KXC2_9BACT|nr:SDR family oxidoreductase [Geoanaerobacter pelophilus]MBT0663273.1 SDR family oxidoreductase [Geoanaerobacter pelophilus]
MHYSEKIFIVGCGDIGRRIAKLGHAMGWQPSALLRTTNKLDPMREIFELIIEANLDDPSTLESLPTADATIFYLAPPPGGGIIDSRMRNFCAALAPDRKPKKVVYLSTSGVYGDCGDLTVTEKTPVNPQTTRAKRRLDAETTITGWGRDHGVPVVILRVTGIYGPGRLPLQHLMSGTPLLSEKEAPITNRIHADDLARVCIAAADRGEDGDIVNVSDGDHGTMTQYFNAIADLLGIARPRQVSREEAAATMPPLLYSYFSESRRIDNSLMKNKLGVKLLYPTLADGLPSCKPEQWPTTSNQQ